MGMFLVIVALTVASLAYWRVVLVIVLACLIGLLAVGFNTVTAPASAQAVVRCP